MIFRQTPLQGAYIIEMERDNDDRGYFARTYSADAFAKLGLKSEFVQCSVSFNVREGTLRGLHYQAPPFEEAKLVRCTRGSAFDVIVDLRAQSPTYRQWFSAVLSADNGLMMYVPEGFAHGFQTLADSTELFYQISQVFSPAHTRRLRWDDPTLEIGWPPVRNRILSERDADAPLLDGSRPTDHDD